MKKKQRSQNIDVPGGVRRNSNSMSPSNSYGSSPKESAVISFLQRNEKRRSSLPHAAPRNLAIDRTSSPQRTSLSARNTPQGGSASTFFF